LKKKILIFTKKSKTGTVKMDNPAQPTTDW